MLALRRFNPIPHWIIWITHTGGGGGGENLPAPYNSVISEVMDLKFVKPE